MKLLFPFLVVSLCLCSQAIAQQPKAVPLPTWISAKWAPDLPEYRQIRQQLEVLKFGPKRDLGKVRNLLAQHAVPLLQALQSMGVTKRKVAVKDIFWKVALEAYFPNESVRVKLNTAYVLKRCPIEPTYEFARVAYCVYTQDASYDGPQTKLAQRLLAKDPNDQLVRIHFIDMSGSVQGYVPEVHDKAVEYAESLKRSLIYRQDLVQGLLMRAYEVHFGHSLKRSSYVRFMAFLDKVINDASLPQEERDVLRRHKAYWKSMEKKVPFKNG